MADATASTMANTQLPGGTIASILSAGMGLYDLFGAGGQSAQGITNTAARVADPIMDQRSAYGGQLWNLMTNPSSFMLSPAAQAQLDIGSTNLQRQLAARRMGMSGNELAELQGFGQQIASQDYQNQFDRLALLSGAKTGSPTSAAQALLGNLTNRNNALANTTGGIAGILSNPTVANSLSSLGNQAGSLIKSLFGGSSDTGTGTALQSYLQQLGISPQDYQLNSADELAGIMGDIAGNQGIYDAWQSLLGGATDLESQAALASWIDSADSGIDGIDWSSFSNAGSATNAAGSGAGSATSVIGSYMPYVAGALAANNIVQGNGGIGDYWNLGKAGYTAYTGNPATLGNMYSSLSSYFAPSAGATAGTGGTAAGVGSAAGETMSGGALSGTGGYSTAGLAGPAIALAAFIGLAENHRMKEENLTQTNTNHLNEWMRNPQLFRGVLDQALSSEPGLPSWAGDQFSQNYLSVMAPNFIDPATGMMKVPETWDEAFSQRDKTGYTNPGGQLSSWLSGAFPAYNFGDFGSVFTNWDKIYGDNSLDSYKQRMLEYAQKEANNYNTAVNQFTSGGGDATSNLVAGYGPQNYSIFGYDGTQTTANPLSDDLFKYLYPDQWQQRQQDLAANMTFG